MSGAPSSPYKGLRPFDDSDLDARLFFGRERDREVIAANMLAARLTVLYGPSGVGKSSVLNAGVARQLRELPEQPLVVLFSSWSEAPARALAESVAAAAGIAQAGRLVDVLEEAARRHTEVFVILDQAEELFLYDSDGFVEEFPEAREPTRPAGERAAQRPRRRSLSSRRVQVADPGRARQLPAARPAEPRRGPRRHRQADRVLVRPGERSGSGRCRAGTRGGRARRSRSRPHRPGDGRTWGGRRPRRFGHRDAVPPTGHATRVGRGTPDRLRTAPTADFRAPGRGANDCCRAPPDCDRRAVGSRARHRRPSFQSPRHAIRIQGGTRGLRPRRVCGCVARRGSAGRRATDRRPHPADCRPR